MTATIYVPGTEEKDLKKIIQSLQAIGAYLTKGNLAFPADQNASTDPNTLDDYEEGTWTPVITFATPGDLAVVYSLRSAYYTKIGRLVSVSFAMVTSTFTHTTASGNLLITGLPFTPMTTDANYRAYAPVLYSGVTKAGYAALSTALIGNSPSVQVFASGSGVAISNVTAADMPTGGTVAFGGSVNYVV
jgi:hypothetical protein